MFYAVAVKTQGFSREIFKVTVYTLIFSNSPYYIFCYNCFFFFFHQALAQHMKNETLVLKSDSHFPKSLSASIEGL